MRKPARMIYQTEATRANILDVAETLFVEKGFAETQMKDVAIAAGISRASLYRYYRDKVDLGFAVLNMVAEKFTRQFGKTLAEVGGGNARERLVNIALKIVAPEGFETDTRFIAEFDAFFSSSKLPEDFGHRLPSAHDALVDRLRDIAREGIEEGSIRPDMQALEVVNLVVTTLRTVQHTLLLRGEALTTFSKKERNNYLQRLGQIISDGLKPQ